MITLPGGPSESSIKAQEISKPGDVSKTVFYCRECSRICWHQTSGEARPLWTDLGSWGDQTKVQEIIVTRPAVISDRRWFILSSLCCVCLDWREESLLTWDQFHMDSVLNLVTCDGYKTIMARAFRTSRIRRAENQLPLLCRNIRIRVCDWTLANMVDHVFIKITSS